MVTAITKINQENERTGRTTGHIDNGNWIIDRMGRFDAPSNGIRLMAQPFMPGQVSLTLLPPVQQAYIPPAVAEGLAGLPDDQWIDQATMAEAFGVVDRTLRRMVERGEVPPPIPLAGGSRWKVGRVREWLDNRARQAEADANEARKRDAEELARITERQIKEGLR